QELKRMAEPFVDCCRFDTLGKLIAHKKGSGPRYMFAAHMDTIGLIVTHIEKDGFLRFGKLGSVHAPSLLHTPVRFRSGLCGLVSRSQKVCERDISLDDLYLDIGAKNEAEARSMIKLGDTAVFHMPSFAAGSRITSPYMDNRISCIALLEAMEMLKEEDNDLYFVFTVQEELGMRGAKTAAYAIDPDYGIAVDVTLADELDSTHKGSCVLGGGAAIKVMDQSVISHPQIVERLSNLATTHNIPHQRDVMIGSGTDAGAIHMTRNGVLTGGISIPCRYIHSGVETVETADVKACARLIAAFAHSK
ncbi:MAG: M20/M25/M40 family metallo-hydrolase, partial [Evtepia sp.]